MASLEGLILDVLMDGSLARNFRGGKENIAPASTTTGRIALEALMDGPVWDARMANLASIFRDALVTITAGQVSVAPMNVQVPTTAGQVLIALDQITASRVLIAPIVHMTDVRARVSRNNLSTIVLVSASMHI